MSMYIWQALVEMSMNGLKKKREGRFGGRWFGVERLSELVRDILFHNVETFKTNFLSH